MTIRICPRCGVREPHPYCPNSGCRQVFLPPEHVHPTEIQRKAVVDALHSLIKIAISEQTTIMLNHPRDARGAVHRILHKANRLQCAMAHWPHGSTSNGG